MKFAELLVYNEGRKSASECAYEAGYKTRPRQAASELRNPKVYPLVAKYIGELRAEVQEKYAINFEKGWKHGYCPKASTLFQYGYEGPFNTKDELRFRLKELNKIKRNEIKNSD